MYDRLLIPTDGSDVAAVAAETAVTLAARFDAELHVLHVQETGDLLPGLDDDGADEFAALGRRAVEDAAERAAEAGVETTTAFIEGERRVHRGILEYATDNDVDCIVMGTSGRTGVGRYLLGSVAEQTLRHSSVPVLTVHEDTAVRTEFERVLVPTDGSKAAAAALDAGIDLSLATGSALHVVHVVDLGVVWGDVDVGMILDALEESGQRALDRAIERAEAAGVSTVASSLLQGSPHRAILDYADDRDVDCVVVGTHGRTGIDRYLLGSVTERVVRLSDIPVLALHAPEE